MHVNVQRESILLCERKVLSPSITLGAAPISILRMFFVISARARGHLRVVRLRRRHGVGKVVLRTPVCSGGSARRMT